MLDKLLYADDHAKMPKQRQIARGYESNDLTTSYKKKIEVVYQPAHGKPYSEPTITENGQIMQVLDKFTYFVERSPLMIRLLPALRKTVWSLTHFVQMSGNGMDLDWTLS